MKKKKIMGVGLLTLSTLALGLAAFNVGGTTAKVKADCNHTSYEFHQGVAPTDTKEGYPDHYGCCLCGAAAEDSAFTRLLAKGTDDVGSRYNVNRQNAIAMAKSTGSGTVIEAANVKSSTLKTIVPEKMKNLDQGTTPDYRSVDNKETLHFTHTHTDETTYQEGTNGYSEFRFDVSGLEINTISFEYKLYDLNHDVYSTESHMLYKWKTTAGLYPSQSLNLINDNEWHTATVYTEDLQTHSDYVSLQFDIQHFTGEMFVSSLSVNTIRSDVDLRTVSLETLNYGNMFKTSHTRVDNPEVGSHAEAVLEPNTKDQSYNSARVKFDAVPCTSDTNYLKVDILATHPTATSVTNLQLFKSVDDPENPGKPTPTRLDTIAEFPTGSWQTLYFDASQFADSGTIQSFGLFASFAGNEYTFTIGSIEFVSQKEPVVMATGVEYDLVNNAYVLNDVTGDLADSIKTAGGLKDANGDTITFISGEDGLNYVNTYIDGIAYPVEVAVVTKYITTADEYLANIFVDPNGGKDNTGYYVIANDITDKVTPTININSNANSYGFYGTVDGKGHYVNFYPGAGEFNGMFGTSKFKDTTNNVQSVIKNITFNVQGGAWMCGRLFGYQADNLYLENVVINKTYQTSFSDKRTGYVFCDTLHTSTFVNCTFNSGCGEYDYLSYYASDNVFINCKAYVAKAEEDTHVYVANTTATPDGLTLINEQYTTVVDAADCSWASWTFTEGWIATVKLGDGIVDADSEGIPEGATGKVAYINSSQGYNGYYLKTNNNYFFTSVIIRLYAEADEGTTSLDLLKYKTGTINGGSNNSFTISANQWTTITFKADEISRSGQFEGFLFMPKTTGYHIYIDSFTLI